MKVVVITESNHGVVGIAKTYADAVHYLIKENWLDETTQAGENDIAVKEDLGEKWLSEILNFTMDDFNMYFSASFYLFSDEVYEHK